MYEALSKRFKDQDPRAVFAHFGWREENNETWESPFQKLAEKAKTEQWDFDRPEFKKSGRSYPIIANYLNYTFLRLQQQSKFKFSSDNTKACFNTGLQTPEGKDIFAAFYRNQNAEERIQPDWTLFGYFDGYSDKMREFEPLPDIATYIEYPSELVFDHHFDLEVDYKHILNDNKERLPSVLQGNPALARNAVEGAVRQLKERLKRNYKLAVPHWYDERIQLLLPLCITDDNIADVALVAEKDIDRKKYMVRTVLTMDMAYIDARIICAPDRQWLNPRERVRAGSPPNERRCSQTLAGALCNSAAVATQLKGSFI